MLNVLGGNYVIIEELAIQWMPSAARIPVEEDPPKAVYPVWLMDSLGIRAAIFVRCPTCQSPLGISPSDTSEQKDWNQEEPKLTSIIGCAKCANLWLITTDRAYHLQVLPAPPVHIPRILKMPLKAGNDQTH